MQNELFVKYAQTPEGLWRASYERRSTAEPRLSQFSFKRMSAVQVRRLRESFRVDRKASIPVESREKRDKHLLDINVPDWYRGLSSFQRKACEKLHAALRDDKYENTTYRLEDCLTQIGLRPRISGQQVGELLQMSRGNDLAFLYFLLEWHYKTPGPRFTINEQLIMSCIAYLDLRPTLRALDTILPPPQMSLKDMRRRQRRWKEFVRKLRQREKALLPQKKCQKIRGSDKFAPYFEPYRQPQPTGKPLWIPDPEFEIPKANFYGPRTNKESDRWFATFRLDDKGRITKRLLHEQIDRILQNFDSCDVDRETVDSLCAHHKMIEDLQKSLEAKLQVIAAERCRRYLDPSVRHQEAVRSRVLKRLEADIESYMSSFNKVADASRKQTLMKILSQQALLSLPLDHNLQPHDRRCKQLDPGEMKCCGKDLKTEKVWVNGVQVTRICDQECDAAKGPQRGKVFAPDSPDFRCMGDGFDVARNSKKKGPAPSRSADSGFEIDPSPKTSESFFRCATAHQPMKFNYRKIFDLKTNTPQVLNIKRAFIEAIDNDVKQLNRLHKSEADVGRVAAEAAERMWSQNVAGRKSAMIAEGGDKAATHAIFTYTQSYYDPNDSVLLLQMAKDALDYIRRDRHYVLASLPDAHKLPDVIHFLRHRFGRRYTKQERLQYLRESDAIFNAIQKADIKVPMPRSWQMGLTNVVPYSMRTLIAKKAADTRRKYYRQIDELVMKNTRNFWFAMRPYHCSNGPPRDTYFAYMPSSVNHVKHFKLWHSSEYRPYAQYWRTKMAMKKM